jgi:hypothetical protein
MPTEPHWVWPADSTSPILSSSTRRTTHTDNTPGIPYSHSGGSIARSGKIPVSRLTQHSLPDLEPDFDALRACPLVFLLWPKRRQPAPLTAERCRLHGRPQARRARPPELCRWQHLDPNWGCGRELPRTPELPGEWSPEIRRSPHGIGVGVGEEIELHTSAEASGTGPDATRLASVTRIWSKRNFIWIS